jgi:hypothetical protein
MSRKVELCQSVVLHEDDEVVIDMPEGTIVEVLLEYENPDYVGGIALVVFDGKEAVSICKGLVIEVE